MVNAKAEKEVIAAREPQQKHMCGNVRWYAVNLAVRAPCPAAWQHPEPRREAETLPCPVYMLTTSPGDVCAH